MLHRNLFIFLRLLNTLWAATAAFVVASSATGCDIRKDNVSEEETIALRDNVPFLDG